MKTLLIVLAVLAGTVAISWLWAAGVVLGAGAAVTALAGLGVPPLFTEIVGLAVIVAPVILLGKLVDWSNARKDSSASLPQP